MVAWRGTSTAKSQVTLYEWQSDKYVHLKTAETAPLPANKWFAMLVRVIANKVTVFTNKDPIADPAEACSQTGVAKKDPVNCDGNQEALSFTFPMPYLEKGNVGLYFAGGSGFSDDLVTAVFFSIVFAFVCVWCCFDVLV